MTADVRIPTILRTFTDGAKVVQADGSDVAAVLADLEVKFPGIHERLVDDNGLRRFVNVYVNDEDVRFQDGLNTAVAEGATVTILPAVAGG